VEPQAPAGGNGSGGADGDTDGGTDGDGGDDEQAAPDGSGT